MKLHNMKLDLFKQYLEAEIESCELEGEKLLIAGRLTDALQNSGVINSLKTTLHLFNLIFSDSDSLDSTPPRGVTCNAEEQHGATEDGLLCKGQRW